MIRVNANLFRIAMACASTEKTRYYLNGVFIEAHPVRGVTLTATDGHRLLSLYDDSGVCDEPAIVQLSAEALKACKPAKTDPTMAVRFVVVEGKAAKIEVWHDEKPLHAVAFSPDCIVDGTFPDHRSVVRGATMKTPQEVEKIEKHKHYGARWQNFDQRLVASFCTVAQDLANHYKAGSRGVTGQIAIKTIEAGAPSLVCFNEVPNAFGVLMPFRHAEGWEPRLPAWFNVATEAKAAGIKKIAA